MRIANNPVRSSGASAERSKPRDDRRVSSSAGGVYRGTKRNCSERARWRLVRGQSAQRLSVHYQLDCDFGTSTLAIYNEGDAVFLCENHVSAIEGPRDKSIAGVRPIDMVANAGDEQGPACGEAGPQHEDIAEVVLALLLHSTDKGPQAEEGQQEKSESRKSIADSPIDAAVSAGVLNPAQIEHAMPMHQPAFEPLVASAASASLEAPAAPKPQREMSPSIARAPVRDLAYGNSAKALVDETIWNMATGDRIAYWSALQQGKGALEAAQAAGGQLAIVHRKIADYTAKIEAIVSQSNARISVSDTVDRPLEQAILEIIGSTTTDDAAKDVAVDHLGSFQQRIKCGLDREFSPLQAHIIARSIGDAANWGFASSLPDEVKPAYRAVYGNIRDAIRAAVPEARELDERLANLFAAKCEIETTFVPKALHALSV